MRQWWVQDEIIRNKLHKNFIVHSLKTVIIPFTSQTAECTDKQIITLLIGSNGCVWGKNKITRVCKQSASEYTYLGIIQRGTSWFIQVFYCCVRLTVLKVTLLNTQNLLDTTPCWFIKSYQCFEEMQCILLEGQAVHAWGLGLYDPEVGGTSILQNTGNIPAGLDIHVALLIKRWKEWDY